MNSSPSHPVSVPAWHVLHSGPAALAASDFHLVETPLARPAEGEVLIRTRWISLDPYLSFPMIGSGSDGGSWAVAGRTIGEVMESRDAAVPVGATVLVTAGWRGQAGGDRGTGRNHIARRPVHTSPARRQCRLPGSHAISRFVQRRCRPGPLRPKPLQFRRVADRPGSCRPRQSARKPPGPRKQR